MIDELDPDWRSDPNKRRDLLTYLEIKERVDEQMVMIASGPDDEYVRAENSLLMCQRVDLWCAGEDEVEHAIQHLYMLGKRLNSQDRFKDEDQYITEFYPGARDF